MVRTTGAHGAPKGAVTATKENAPKLQRGLESDEGFLLAATGRGN